MQRSIRRERARLVFIVPTLTLLFFALFCDIVLSVTPVYAQSGAQGIDWNKPWLDWRVQNCVRRYLTERVLAMENEEQDRLGKPRFTHIDEWGRLLSPNITPTGKVDGAWENPTHYVWYAYNRDEARRRYGQTVEEWIRQYCLPGIAAPSVPQAATPAAPASQGPKVVKLIIVPSSETIQVGESISFRALAEYDSGGKEDVTGKATWSPGKTFKGNTPGVFYIAASFEDQAEAARVNVKASQRFPSPPPQAADISDIIDRMNEREQQRTDDVGTRRQDDIYTGSGYGTGSSRQDELTEWTERTRDEFMPDPEDHHGSSGSGGGGSTPQPTKPPSKPPGGQGLTNITVKSQKISVTFWDHGQEDGDIIDILLNGKLIRKGIVLKKLKQSFPVTLNKGNNVFGVRAVNEGSVSPNTATVQFSDVTQGKDLQVYEIKSNQKTDMNISVNK